MTEVYNNLTQILEKFEKQEVNLDNTRLEIINLMHAGINEVMGFILHDQTNKIVPFLEQMKKSTVQLPAISDLERYKRYDEIIRNNAMIGKITFDEQGQFIDGGVE